MSQYFNFFPKLDYDIDGGKYSQLITSVNFFTKFNISEDGLAKVSNFYPYVVRDGERADIISFNYYGDVKYTWLIYIANDILDPLTEWPKSQSELINFITEKYGSIGQAKDVVHHYEQIVNDGVDTLYYEVDYDTYTELDAADKRIISNYDYEITKNEQNREINLIEDIYIQDIFREFTTRVASTYGR